MSETDELRAEVAELRQAIRGYEHCVAWDTTCRNCADTLDAAYRETVRAETAEAEVERLTRECLDREATETDARERLRRVEAAVLERAANDWTAGEWAMAFRQGGPLTKAQDVADWLRARARATND